MLETLALENYEIGKLISRNRTPPYLYILAEVKHVDLATLDPNSMPILFLCSDGLCHLCKAVTYQHPLPKDVQLWLITTSRIERRGNLALDLQWDALDGDGDVEETTKIVRGLHGRRIDDTIVVVIQL